MGREKYIELITDMVGRIKSERGIKMIYGLVKRLYKNEAG